MFTSLAAYSEEKAQRKRPPRQAVESVTQTLSPCQMCRGMSGRPNVTEASMAKKQASAYLTQCNRERKNQYLDRSEI